MKSSIDDAENGYTLVSLLMTEIAILCVIHRQTTYMKEHAFTYSFIQQIFIDFVSNALLCAAAWRCQDIHLCTMPLLKNV